jgi:hypothetical protein
MGCLNITSLVLSDTFNTWFQRTNECIEGLNSFEIRGLSATNTSNTDVKGFVIENDGDCYYTLNIRTGPFIGFVTSSDGGYDSAIHGTGNYEDPYNLTLKFNGTEEVLDKDEVVTGDYLIVSDTDDNGLLKKTTADAFLTRLQAGSKIQVTQGNDGVWTISYVPLFFTATFKDKKYDATLITREIGFTHNSSAGWTGAYNYGPTTTTNPEEVLPYSISIGARTSPNDSAYMTFTSFGGTGGGDIFYASSPTPTIPNSKSWFSTSKTDLVIEAGITSATASGASPFYSFTAEKVTRTVTYRFGWRFAGFSTTSELNLAGVQNYMNTNNTTMALAGSGVVQQGGASKGYLISSPSSAQRTATFSAEGRLYFLVTADDNYSYSSAFDFNDTYGYTPVFRDPLGGAIMEEGWEELGTVTGNFQTSSTYGSDNVTKNYIVYRSTEAYDPNRQIIIS